MKYFRQLETDVAARPFLAELAAVSRTLPQARAARIGAHGMASAFHIRAPATSRTSERARNDVHESRWTEISRPLRYTRNFLRRFARERCVELGRAKLVLAPAGHRIHPRIDKGEYHLFRDRYHLVLQSTGGSWLKAGDESVTLREGELWWFDNNTVYEAWNPCADACIHLVFDALNADGRRMLAQAARVRTARERDAATPVP